MAFVEAGNTKLQTYLNEQERILVVIQLDGGNDGINTVVPYADEGYAKSRDKLRLPTNQLIKVNDSVGLHPSLRPAADLPDLDLADAHGAGADVAADEGRQQQGEVHRHRRDVGRMRVTGDPADELAVTWRASADPEGAAVQYRWQLSQGAGFTAAERVLELDAGADTTTSIAYGDLAARLDAHGVLPAQTVQWHHRVVASDLRLTGFGDSSVDLELRIWVTDPEKGVVNIASDLYVIGTA